MKTLPLAHMRWLCPLLCIAGMGCPSTGPANIPTEPERRHMLSLMLPTEIKIQPFTKIASFDGDEVPDGILMVLQPVDRFGDPVKAAGLFYFELWTYQKASGEHKGRRLAFWEHVINSHERIELQWTRAQTYEFQLGWTAGAETIVPGNKYVLTATYRAPWNETLTDERVLEFNLPAAAMRETAQK